ncbi:hypothetical protein JHK82_016461 [Glycine max]|uniref:DYW domain-containing protein n=1 Tax=Glycine max TaxID=3847 RepID=A0A0R0JRI1_SOYBN|nr:hypothetical protein JHK85_016876 [Glycine max]KAG5149580.1 hypothetical protein JHK82_016461 [Glycine max]KAH1127572.1 hypothetical protein GYH30_016254 [Glycine max]KRH55426.1 hypothetical protein GLYMA_06G254600v4 [Glycine max]
MTSGDHGRMNTANQLPAMLSHVISWLSIDEAVRSSILPKRWKPLWKHASCLDFDVSSVIKSLSQLENSSSRVKSVQVLTYSQEHTRDYRRCEDPCSLSLSKLIACLSPDDLLEHGMPIHAHIVVAGFELDTFVQSSLITMYAQCGDLNTSNYIFDVLANKNSSTWNAILPANAHYGPGEEALKLIIKMKNDGVHLDQFSFSVALAIVGNLTLLDEGQQLHSLIIKHGFESNDYVLNTTMDMYGKCGEIDDGFRILPQPRSSCLVSLLVRNVITHSPCVVCIKLKNQVTIGMGDQYLPQNAEIYAKLEELKKMISEASYVHTSYSLQDTDEEQKEHILWNHSERIAHAFGICKNFSFSGDCLSVFKMVSQIIGRKIIIRNAYRFHHFRSGKCSCSDYW